MAPRPSAAQEGSLEFADLAIGVFGVMCLFVDQAPEADLAARLLGLYGVPAGSPLSELMLPGTPEATWAMNNSGRILTLVRREADGACLMDLIGLEPSTLQNTLDQRMAMVRSPTTAVVIEDVPRPFPRPPLRARYRLTTSQGAGTLVELHVVRQAGFPDRPVLIARPAP